MSDTPAESIFELARNWDSLSERQRRSIARNMTPLQRLHWLEEKLRLLGPRYPELVRNRERFEQKAQDT